MATIAAIIGRVLISLVFIVTGANKILDPSGTEELLTAGGFSPEWALAIAIFQILGGLAIALGLGTRIAAVLLAAFLIMTIIIYRQPLNDVFALKNLAIAGGLLLVFAYGRIIGDWKLVRANRESELEAAEAREKLHEAELRAVRAEGRAAAAEARTSGNDDGDVGEAESEPEPRS